MSEPLGTGARKRTLFKPQFTPMRKSPMAMLLSTCLELGAADVVTLNARGRLQSVAARELAAGSDGEPKSQLTLTLAGAD